MPSADTTRVVILSCLLAVLAGCDDPATEGGVPPVLALEGRSVSVPLRSYGAARRLREAVDSLANGDTARLRASIRTADAAEAQAVRARLIDDGISPSAVSVRGVPDDVVVVSGAMVHATSCHAALRPGYLGDVANSVDSLGRCVQANNLAAMVADPAELVAPAPLAPTDGAVAARAVLDWQQGAVRQPPSPENLNEAGAGTGGGEAGSLPAAGATGGYGLRADGSSAMPPQSAPTGAAAPPINPLFAPGL